MSTLHLNGLIWSRCSIALTYPFRSHFQRTLNKGTTEQRVRMNAAAHQEKEKNEKTGKRNAGKERRQENDFKEAACCHSAVIRGQHGEKMVCVGGVLRVTGTLGKANSHFDPTQTGLGKAPPC